MLPAQFSKHPLLFILSGAPRVLTFLRCGGQILAKIVSFARNIRRTKTCGTRREELIETTIELTLDLQKHSARVSFSGHSIRRSGHPEARDKAATRNPQRKSRRRIFGLGGSGGL